MWQHRHYTLIFLSGLAFPFLAGYLYNGWVGGMSCFMLAGIGRTFAVLNSTFCINSVCHLWGSQPHGHADSSRDSWAVSCLRLAKAIIITTTPIRPTTATGPSGTTSTHRNG